MKIASLWCKLFSHKPKSTTTMYVAGHVKFCKCKRCGDIVRSYHKPKHNMPNGSYY